MRSLVTLTVVMGVLIVAGTATLGALIVRRLTSLPPPLPPLALEEPTGTRITGMTGLGERLVLRLEGGGPDRLVVIDPSRALVVGRIALTH